MANLLSENVPEQIYTKVQQLSLDNAKEVLDFVEFMEYKSKSQSVTQQKAEATAKLRAIGQTAKIGDIVSPTGEVWEAEFPQ